MPNTKISRNMWKMYDALISVLEKFNATNIINYNNDINMIITNTNDKGVIEELIDMIKYVTSGGAPPPPPPGDNGAGCIEGRKEKLYRLFLKLKDNDAELLQKLLQKLENRLMELLREPNNDPEKNQQYRSKYLKYANAKGISLEQVFHKKYLLYKMKYMQLKKQLNL